jgi:hypothetical protein
MDLRVYIPIKFKEKLERRFNPEIATYDEFTKEYKNRVSCVLCDTYLNLGIECKGCPFERFADYKKRIHGCLRWLEVVMGKIPRGLRLMVCLIVWDKKWDKGVRKWFTKLKEMAKELIIWEGKED